MAGSHLLLHSSGSPAHLIHGGPGTGLRAAIQAGNLIAAAPPTGPFGPGIPTPPDEPIRTAPPPRPAPAPAPAPGALPPGSTPPGFGPSAGLPPETIAGSQRGFGTTPQGRPFPARIPAPPYVPPFGQEGPPTVAQQLTTQQLSRLRLEETARQLQQPRGQPVIVPQGIPLGPPNVNEMARQFPVAQPAPPGATGAVDARPMYGATYNGLVPPERPGTVGNPNMQLRPPVNTVGSATATEVAIFAVRNISQTSPVALLAAESHGPAPKNPPVRPDWLPSLDFRDIGKESREQARQKAYTAQQEAFRAKLLESYDAKIRAGLRPQVKKDTLLLDLLIERGDKVMGVARDC